MTTISEQMAAWGRTGGQSRSEKKREAARKNVAASRAKIGKVVPHDLQPGCGCVIPTSAPTPAPRVPAVLIPAQPKEGQ